jgi:Tol biopolymer transport system component
LVVSDSASREDLYLVSLATTGAAPVPLARSRFREYRPRISPDGHWLAYTSDETGRDEIYVRPLDRPGARVKVSNGGARLAQWASRGTRLVYDTDGGRSIAATLSASGPSFNVVRQDTVAIAGDGVRIDIDARTDRVLAKREPDDRRIIVVSNWLSEVKAKLQRQ